MPMPPNAVPASLRDLPHRNGAPRTPKSSPPQRQPLSASEYRRLLAAAVPGSVLLRGRGKTGQA